MFLFQFFWKSIPFNTSNSPPSDNLNDQKLSQELKDRIIYEKIRFKEYKKKLRPDESGIEMV